MTETPTQKLASSRLGEPVHTWITNRRNDGRSLRLIARMLYELTDGEIDVTPETIRQWSSATLEVVA